ncbi:hypothetical protein KAW65_05860, partial [candidate division WOR-3 bacterium]|nr:hypothetical protein [candidate division WOR-3 bacterium]
MFRGFRIFAIAIVAVVVGNLIQAATWMVTKTEDSSTGTEGTLRWAMVRANNNSDPDTIRFDSLKTSDPGYIDPDGIPGSGDEYWSITLRSCANPVDNQLPAITDGGTVIDGYTAPGAQPASDLTPAVLKIEINATTIPEEWCSGAVGPYPQNFCSAIRVGRTGVGGAPGTIIKGLCINRSGDCGIIFDGGTNINGCVLSGCYIGTNIRGDSALGNHVAGVVRAGCTCPMTIGGPTPADRNVVSGNWMSNVMIAIAHTDSMNIVGNYIGTDATGMNTLPPDSIFPDEWENIESHGQPGYVNYIDYGNGILLWALTGGPTHTNIYNNVISGNARRGILMRVHYTYPGPGAIFNVSIKNNLIGVAPDTLTPVPNKYGIGVIGDNSFPIHEVTIQENIISCNLKHGIGLWYTPVNVITNNWIGTNAFNNLLGNGGDGIRLAGYGCCANTIQNNIIKHNDRHGIYNGTTHDSNITIWSEGDTVGVLGYTEEILIMEYDGDNLIDNNMIAINDSCGIYNLGASPKIINNQFTDNGKYGIGNFVHFGGTYAPEDYSDD